MNPWEIGGAQTQQDIVQKMLNDLNDKQKAAQDPYHKWVSSFDPASMPDRVGAVGADGKLKNDYLLQAGADVAYDPNVANSPWMKMLLDQEGLQRGQQLDSAAAQSNAGRAGAYSAMATRGGLRAGAAERIATKSARDLMTGRQDINRSGDISRLGLVTGGMEKQAGLDQSNRAYKTDVQAKNIATLMQDASSANQYNLGKYDTQAKAWAADRTAQAQEKGK